MPIEPKFYIENGILSRKLSKLYIKSTRPHNMSVKFYATVSSCSGSKKSQFVPNWTNCNAFILFCTIVYEWLSMRNELELIHSVGGYTHELIKLFIAAMAYYINTLDSQSSGRDRCGPNYFKVGDLFWKICTSLYANFWKKKSHPICPVEGLKLCLDFLCNTDIST